MLALWPLRFARPVAVILPLLFCTEASSLEETTVVVKTRSGQTIRALVIVPERAKGTVILLAGGHGNLSLTEDGKIGWGRGNQLVRTRGEYARLGYLTLVPDVARDLKVGQGVQAQYRWSREHAEDIGRLVAYARTIAPPVYLVGTSRAALSVANAAVRTSGNSRPDALVITSGMLMHIDENQPSVEGNVPHLEQITQPMLLVFHKFDACVYTPASSAGRFKSLLTHAARIDIQIMEGGDPGPSAPCEAKSHHGFFGMDNGVVRSITDWLEASGGN